MLELTELIKAKMNRPTLSGLATLTEDGRPWVRYVTAWMEDDLTIWFTTFQGSRKAAQIRQSPEVHLTCGVTDMETAETYLQVQGRAEILDSPEIKREKWLPVLENIFSGPDDPNYCVCRISPYRIEYQGMTSEPPRVWES